MPGDAVRVNVFYPTDFGGLSRGGILSFLSTVGAHASVDTVITYVGMGSLAGELPRATDQYVSLCPPPRRGPVNLAFLSALRRGGTWPDADVHVIHRAEHALALPTAPPAAMLLHGGFANAWRARPGLFGLAYPLIESLAARRAALTMAVAPDHVAPSTSRLATVHWMPTTYDDRLFHVRRPTAQGQRNRVLLVGRLVKEKRFDLALRAIASSRTAAGERFTVDVLGDGPRREELEALAARLRLHARFSGMAAPRDVAEHHGRGDAILLVTSRFEGFPVAAVEAAAGGSAVVALAAPGTTEAITRLGGVVADRPSDLPTLLREASARRHEADAAAVSGQFGPASVSARFWTHVLAARRAP